MTRLQQECPHSRPMENIYIRESGTEDDYDWVEGHWEEVYPPSVWEDISLRQYKCNLCNLVFNYSGGNPHHILDEEKKEEA